MNEADFPALIQAVKALAEPNSADCISAIATVVAAFGAIFAAWFAYFQYKKNSDLDFNREAIKSLNTFYHDAFCFIYDHDLEKPINKQENWSLASDSIKLADKHYQNLKKNSLKKSAKLEKERWQKKLLVHIEKGDSKKNSLRMQFFTGLGEWQSNNDSMEKLIDNKKVYIGSGFSEFDDFGNTDKGSGISNIAIEDIITIYSFMLGYESITIEELKKVWIAQEKKYKDIWPKNSCRGFHRFFIDYVEAKKTE